MDIKRKQHVLPESYLKHWADPSTRVPGKTPMVWTFTKDAKQKRLRPPASGQFWRDYFYDLISVSGERRQDVENLLARIEGSFARIVEQRIVLKQPLEMAEAEALDLFVACMFMRTQRMKDTLTSAVSAMARIEKDYARAHGKPAPDTSAWEHNAHPHAIYDGILFISQELTARSHNIFIAPEGRAYLTSDTPCVWQAPIGPTGLANSMLEVTLPLTPLHLLHISKSIPTSGYIEVPEFFVDHTNWEMIRRCQSYFVNNSPVIHTSCLETQTYWAVRILQAAAQLG